MGWKHSETVVEAFGDSYYCVDAPAGPAAVKKQVAVAGIALGAVAGRFPRAVDSEAMCHVPTDLHSFRAFAALQFRLTGS